MRLFFTFLLLFCLHSLTWAVGNNIHFLGHDNYSLADAFQVGVDTNGRPLYLCLARLYNSTQPGKTWEGYGRCNVPYGGKEYILNDFEVPSQSMFNGTYWQDNSGLAITVGRDSNGTPLFLCQTMFKGSKQPGKTWTGYNHCNISYGGNEIITNNFRVLANDRRSERFHAHPSQDQQCVQSAFGSQACGYHCVQSINRVACASSPDQQCVADNFGHVACGYGCVKTPMKVVCASHKGMNCVINNFNEIACGKNCRVDDFDRIQCDN